MSVLTYVVVQLIENRAPALMLLMAFTLYATTVPSPWKYRPKHRGRRT